MKPHSKLINERIHAKRFGLELNRHDLDAFVQAIRKPDPERAQFIASQSNRVKIWKVRLTTDGKQWAVVAYDKQRRSIITFLPEGNQYESMTTSNTTSPEEPTPTKILQEWLPSHWYTT